MSEESGATAETSEITFKTISSQTFKLTFPLNVTVSDIKQKIYEEKGEEFEVERQKLIYNGKVLENTQTLEEINVDEKKYIVVMAPKKRVEVPLTPKKSDKPAVEQPPSTTQPASSAAPTVTTTTPTTAEAPVAQPSAESQFSLPAEYEETCNSICGMGYPRVEVIRALRAAFFNADRAVEYLCNGIPETMPDNVAEQAGNDAEMSEGEGEGGALAFLRDSPQFAQICQIVRGHPELLPQVLSEISNSNPDLMQTIRENQEAFVQMLNEGASEEAVAAAAAAVPDVELADGEEPAGGHDSGHVTIAITENDRNAIQRLQSMGFPEQLVIEAYFACDKNEDLAVNYILSRMDETQ
ncbi:hypothetical protein M3Y94_01145100 [Aphelenchoides besseyi]|nr:hypothetical protein M3Y94_01145100 [Aphelenchoides besseyi]KAI6227902.1 UV excision repair protein RAD23 [Aphelenchoides besseyi]